MTAYNAKMHLQRASWRGKFLDSNYLVFGTGEDCALYYDGTNNNFVLDRTTGMTELSKAFSVTGYPTDLNHGCRNGVVNITTDRIATYPWGSHWVSGGDGNPDVGLKITAYNRSVSTTTYGAVRGLTIDARNRSSGSCCWVQGAYITAENTDGTVGSILGAQITVKNNGVSEGDVCALRIFDESQSGTGTNYALKIDCTGESAFSREFCIHINTTTTTNGTSTWTNGITFDGNVTNPLDFVDTDGTNGATYSASHYATLGNIDGKIQVDIGGNTLYIPAYVSIAA